MMLAVGSSYIAFTMLRYSTSIPRKTIKFTGQNY
jgi:hypothetical protein